MYLPNYSTSRKMWKKDNFQGEFSYHCFPSPRLVALKPTTKSNESSFIHDLNSDRRFHFLPVTLSVPSHKLVNIYPAPLHEQDETQGQFLRGVKQVWIQSFPSPWPITIPRLNEPSLPNYSSIVGERITGFMPFLKLLAQREMETPSFVSLCPFPMTITITPETPPTNI